MNLTNFSTRARTLLVALIISATAVFSTSCGDGDGGVNLKIPGVQDQLLPYLKTTF